MSDSPLDFCNASIVTLLVTESNDEDEGAIRKDSTTGQDAIKSEASSVDEEANVKKFLVHENLLCSASPVLKATFQGHFAEGGNKVMTIKDLDADSINEFLKWLYRGKRLPEKPKTEGANQLWYLNMARLVVVGDIYQIKGLEEDVIDVLVDGLFIEPPGWPVIEFIYANTPELSNLRRWIVAWYVERIDCEWFCREETSLASLPEFASDLAKAFGRQKKPALASKSFFEMTREERKAPIQYQPQSQW